MTATLLTGAGGHGKTQQAIRQIQQVLERKAFGKVWVLLPTELQISAFRARLLEQTGAQMGITAYFGVEFFDFYDLYGRLLELAGTPQRRVKEAARFRILRYVLTELQDQLEHFDSIAQLPGFVILAADFIQELKQAEIKPDDFAAAAQTAKDRDLAAIYSAYQAFLQRLNLVDGEGEGWLALARLRDTTEIKLDLDLLVIDGYDQFNLVQARLLTLLAQRLPDTTLTLTYQRERAQSAHRRFDQTLRGLRQIDETLWTEIPVKFATNGNSVMPRPEALDYLSQHVFESLLPDLNDADQQHAQSQGEIAMIEAPDRQREVQVVLRRIKQLLLAGISPEQIAIVARNLEPYTTYFLETAAAYGIPVTSRRGTPLAKNPAIAAFMSLLNLHGPEIDFQRRATMDMLHSPYLHSPDLTSEQIARLDLISRNQIVIRGRDHWFEAIERAARAIDHTDSDDESPADTLTVDEAIALRNALEQCFDRITPPSQATARAYVRWLEALIGVDPAAAVEVDSPLEGEDSSVVVQSGAESPDEVQPIAHFDIINQIRLGDEPDIVARDLAALDALKRIFLEVLSAYELIDAYEVVPWRIFWLDLKTAIDNASINNARTINRLGRVLLASVFETRGLSHDHIFLLGLSEGDFPARTPADALYTDEERRRMMAQGLPLLTRAEAADESSLFYEITTLARQSLTLTRPYNEANGNPLPASPYWRATTQWVKITPDRIALQAPIALDEAARLSEVLLALAQAINGEWNDSVSAVHNWIVEQDDLGSRWANALLGRHIESSRNARSIAHDQYSGHLTDPQLREKIHDVLGNQRLWSASQFDEYGICPYRFFAKRLLKLAVVEEREEGLDQLQRGSLYHEILEKTYRAIQENQIAISPQNQEYALQTLDTVLARLLPHAPYKYGFRATALWPYEQDNIRRKLRSLVALDFSDDSPIRRKLFKDVAGERHTVYQEIGFGGSKPFTTLDGTPNPPYIRGKIDRVDEVDGQLVVIDYKSGSGTISTTEMVEGRNVQMLLYIQAARQLFPDKTIAGGAFWHIGSQGISGMIMVDDPQLVEADTLLRQRINDAQQGIFVNAPSKRIGLNGHCSTYCEFSKLCRVERASSQKMINREI
ncbi:MAG: PD-(D/E)XK nuclease family protein [Chloroflexota bacterium]